MGLRKLLVLFNPKAHSGSDAEIGPAFERKLRAAGFDAIVHALEAADELDEIVTKRGVGCDAIVIGGGDGTVRSALPAILKKQLPLAIWPLGTANDFARSLEIESEQDCVDALTAWTQRLVDVAEVNGHYFINNVALGLPLEAATRLTPELKKRLGAFASIALLPALWKVAKPFECEIDADGRRERRTIVAALIGNGAYLGGFPIRYVGLADGQLHATIGLARSRWAMLPILFDVATKRVASSRCIETFSAKRITIRTASPKQIGADGDVVSQTPAAITLHASVLRVFTREGRSK